jgi:imidazolonepropionase-like amidohydrolase
MRSVTYCFLLFIIPFLACGQIITDPLKDVYHNTHSCYAFVNARIAVNPNQMINKGTLIIRDGYIENVGENIPIPADATIIDVQKKYIYPSLIDACAIFEGSKKKEGKVSRNYWNSAVKPEADASENIIITEKEAEKYRKMGIGTVMTHIPDGIFRGNPVIYTTGNKEKKELLAVPDFQMMSFDKGSSPDDYPSSLMGAIALIRQVFLDADWYKKAWQAYSQNPNQQAPEKNLSLEVLSNFNGKYIFEVSDELRYLRAAKIAKEFNLNMIVRASGMEYKRIQNIKETGIPAIVPLTFPVPYDLSEPHTIDNVSLSQLKHWENAPLNPAYFEKNQIPFALTSQGLDKEKFYTNLYKAMQAGLSYKATFSALTTVPAQLLGIDKYVGTLEKGKLANFIICKDSLFKEKNVIYQHWIRGEKYEFTEIPAVDIRGEYALTLENKTIRWLISGKDEENLSHKWVSGKDTLKITVTQKQKQLSIQVQAKKLGYEGTIFLMGYIHDKKPLEITGNAIIQGKTVLWNAKYLTNIPPTTDKKKDKKDSTKKDPISFGTVTYPNMAYGWTELPKAETVLIKNTTVWTCTDKGILKNTDVLIQNGKIAQIGQNLSVSNAKIIDGTNLHLTPGIIDEHSHIAISQGVNEGTQSITSEVRIGDVLYSDDISIYRQLAGGVTSSHLLHGSANCIGGQTQLIKLRWGKSPEELKFENWPGFIKFALGENVKQSNWGDNVNTRYPQTRLGVEQIFIDAFQRAKDYQKAWQDYNANPKDKVPPRKDLELEALVEILDSKRFITCHSYVQSEIVMLMRVAERFQFKVNTFTHILEGYKVADKMKQHGVGASTFADWWAYKFEVMEAIPFNAAILIQMGIPTAINSDDAEMARRLNQESAKGIKYGNMKPEEALKMCTLYPAQILHVADRTGSIETGKDADIVLWTAEPLSVYAKVQQTYVDGICYFDVERDKQMRESIQQERNRIVQKMLAAKKNGENTQKPTIPVIPEYHCETLECDYNHEHE